MKKIFYSIILLVLITACIPDKKKNNCENPNLSFLINESYTKGNNISYDALILNEGGYTYGNASVGLWSNGGITTQTIFQLKNNYNIGDVLQSAYKQQGEDDLYLIINNSQKIEVVDKYNFQRKETITGFTSPRFMATVGEYAFVTDLYAKKISVFNTITNCEMNSIEMNGWTEQIYNINDKIYVIERSEIGASTLFANIVCIEIELNEDNLKSTITKRTAIAIEPQSIAIDNSNNLWILSTGKESKNVYPTLTVFNTATEIIDNVFTHHDYNNIPQNISFAEDLIGPVLICNRGTTIAQINYLGNGFAVSQMFTTVADNIYNISFDKNSEKIFISDAKDYISNGKIYVYDINGNLLETISAGIIPSKVVF